MPLEEIKHLEKRIPAFLQIVVSKFNDYLEVLTLHQKSGSVFIIFTIASFLLFSMPKYFWRREFRLMFESFGSSEFFLISLCAIYVSNTPSQCTSNWRLKALVSSQKSWKTLTIYRSSKIYFSPLENGLIFVKSKI